MNISRPFIFKLTLALICMILAGSFLWYKIYRDASIIFLTPDSRASWIIHDREFDPVGRSFVEKANVFKKTISLSKPVAEAVINTRALRYFKIIFDNRLVYESAKDYRDWKSVDKTTIKNIPTGDHELVIMVLNYDGPPALHAYSNELGIETDASWLSSDKPEQWEPVALAKENELWERAKEFPPSYVTFVDTLPYGLIVFLLTVVGFLNANHSVVQKYYERYDDKIIPSLRWFFVCLWVVLSIFSIINHPLTGNDLPDHLLYIHDIMQKGSLPLATDPGIQSFQSPLFYLIAAFLLKIFLFVFELETAYQLLKIINLLCGLAMIEIIYRSVLVIFPSQRYLQFIGLLVGASLPMHLYNNQYIGNEQLATAFSGLAIFVAIKYLKQPEYTRSLQGQVLIALALGFGLLSKVSVGLLLLPCSAALLYASYSVDNDIKRATKKLAFVAGIVFLMSGWYYIRNWILLGKPFIGGWDPGMGVSWWQYPGYRMFEQYTEFGASLFYPVFSTSVGIWDSLYSYFWSDGVLGGNFDITSRTLWNYSFMLTLPLLSVLPSIAMVTGIGSSVREKVGRYNYIQLYLVSCFFIYLAALLYFSLKVPYYSAGKATYAMGIMPCFALLITFGIKSLTPGRISRAIITGLIVWWAVFSHIAFFPVEYQAPFSQFYLSSQGL